MKKEQPIKDLEQEKIKSSQKKITGKKGESIAVSFLSRKGYRIIERNFKKGYGEIDIIALSRDAQEDVLVFVEVKTRITRKYGHPAESVTPHKIRALKRSAHYYKLLHPELPKLLRLDVVAVELEDDGSLKNLEHIKNVTG